MKALVIQSRCSRVSVGEGGRCYTTSGLPVLPHIGCYSTKDSAKSTSDRSRLKCSDFSHLPSVSIALFHFQSLLSWLTCPPFSIKILITTTDLSVWWALLRYVCKVHTQIPTPCGCCQEIRQIYLCQPAEVRRRQHCKGMQSRMKVEVTVRSEWRHWLRKCTWKGKKGLGLLEGVLAEEDLYVWQETGVIWSLERCSSAV